MRARIALLCTSVLLLAAPTLRAASIRGTAFGRGDAPLAGVTVRLLLEGAPARSATTDARGRYAFEGVRPGSYTLVASKAGLAIYRQAVVVRDAAQRLGVSFRLAPWRPPAWAITGTVYRSDGSVPAAGARVSLSREAFPSEWEAFGETTSSEGGTFNFAGLRPGRYRVHASAKGYLSRSSGEMALREGADRQTAIVVLAVPPRDTVPGTVPIQALDADGKPLAGRAVRLLIDTVGKHTELPWGDGMAQRGNSWAEPPRLGLERRQIEAQALTDAEGRLAVKLPAGTASVTLWAEGFLSQNARVAVPPGRAADPITFRLKSGAEPAPFVVPRAYALPARPGGRVRVRVLRPDGTPLAKTGVYAFVADGDPYGDPWDGAGGNLGRAYALTDDEGCTERADLRTDRAVSLRVKTRGFAASQAPAVTPRATPDAEVVEVRLPGPAPSIAGQVADAAGKPIAGARVYAYRPARASSHRDLWSFALNWWGRAGKDCGPWPWDTPLDTLKPGVIPGMLRCGLSYTDADAQGRFRIPELDAARYEVGATAPGWSRAISSDVTLAPGTPAPQVVLRLQRLGAIAGTLGRPDGQPVVHAALEVAWWRARSSGETGSRTATQTDARGGYRLPDLEPGRYRISLKAAGFRRAEGRGLLVSPGRTLGGVDFTLRPAIVLRGRVLRPDGTPASGATLRWDWGNGPRSEAPGGETASDGTFAIQDLDPGESSLAAWADGYAHAETKLRLPAAAPVTLRLRSAVTISGTVRDAVGAPVTGAFVAWYIRGENGVCFDQYPPGSRTDASGRYRLEGVPAVVDGLTLVVMHEGSRNAGRPMGLAGQNDTVTADFVLQPIRTGSIRGRVLRADGSPAAGVPISGSVTGTPGRRGAAITDEGGRYRIDDCPAGWVHLSFQSVFPERQAGYLRLEPGAEVEVPDVRLLPTGVVAAAVRGLGRAPKGARLSLSLTPACPVPTPGKPTRLHILHDMLNSYLGYLPAREARTLFSGGSGTCYAVAADTGPGEPPSVGIGHPGGLEPFRSGSVPVGRYSARLGWWDERARTSGSVPLAGEVAVADGKTAQVALAVPPLGSVTGRVRRADGAGVPDARIAVVPAGATSGVSSFRAGADAAFAWPYLAPGNYTAYVWEPGLAPTRCPFRVLPGKSARLAITLEPGVTLRGVVEGKLPERLLVSADAGRSFGGATVSADGTFAIEHLLPGPFALHLWEPGGDRIVTRAGTVVGPSGAEGVKLTWEQLPASPAP